MSVSGIDTAFERREQIAFLFPFEFWTEIEALIRYDAIESIMTQVRDETVVCALAHTSQELFKIRHRDKIFYMLGSMGLASSIGHGLALSRQGLGH